MTPDEVRVAVEVARAALAEVGCPAEVFTPKEGSWRGPAAWGDDWCDHEEVVARAFVLAHQAVGHDAWVDVDTWPCHFVVQCRECWPEEARR